MRVSTAKQMAAIDRETIDGGVPGIELMERAGNELVRTLFDLLPDLPAEAPVAVVCGKGNNGGDGLVVARLLARLGFEITVVMLAAPEDLSPDARVNYDRLEPSTAVLTPPREEWADVAATLCDEHAVVIDAVFGTGIKTPVREDYAALFDAIDRRRVAVVSVDAPSGVDGDTGAVDPTAVRADATVTMGLPKLGLLLHPGRAYVGRLAVVDIGFGDEVCARHTDDLHLLPPEDLADLLPSRPGDLHKYRAGSCLLLAGSRDFGGAALLAAGGALRSGAGMVTLGLPEIHAAAALQSTPEALIRGLPVTEAGTLAPLPPEVLDALLAKQDAWAVGPGLGADPATDDWVIGTLGRIALPTVVDADALNAFARRGRPFACAAERTVITPHAGELNRLLGVESTATSTDRVAVAREAAARWGCVLVAKGAPTLIASPDGAVVVNASGDDALAHGGTGDVLTGLMGGLLAQGLPAMDAAVLGCWLHGRAGELTALSGARRSARAGDVIDLLPAATAELTRLAGEDDPS